MSPQSSPEQPHRHFKCSTYSGMLTPSVSSHSPKVGTHLAKSASFHHHVFSDLPHSTQRCAYTPARGNVQQRTFRQTLGLQSVPANAAFRKNGEYGSKWTYRQSTVKPTFTEKMQRRNGDTMFSSIQPKDSMFGLKQKRERGHYKSLRVNSYPPSVSSVETDAGRRAATQLPIKQMHVQNVTKL